MRRFMREVEEAPPAPSDVRAVMADGREVPVECVYVGRREEDGIHEWETAWVLPERPASFRVGVLPALTSVGFRFVKE